MMIPTTDVAANFHRRQQGRQKNSQVIEHLHQQTASGLHGYYMLVTGGVKDHGE